MAMHASVRRMKSMATRRYREELICESERIACAYCHEPLTAKTATADHKIATAKGGMNVKTNIVIACFGCNQAKGSLSAGQFLNILKGGCPREFKYQRAWLSRKIWVRTERAVRHIENMVK